MALAAAAARSPQLATAPAIAAVSTTGYLGLVCGPPMIGLLMLSAHKSTTVVVETS